MPGPRSRRLLAVASALVTGLATVVVAAPAPAPAAEFQPGISGRVTSEDGVPLEGVAVSAGRSTWNGQWVSVAATQTAADGSYRIGTGTGSYEVRFRDPNDQYATEFWPGRWWWDEAQDIYVPRDGTAVFRDATMARAVHINGVVTTQVGTTEEMLPVAFFREYGESLDLRVARSASTERIEDGQEHHRFEFMSGALPPGRYTVSAWSPDAGEFWKDKPSVETADTFVLGAGQTAVRDIHLGDVPIPPAISSLPGMRLGSTFRVGVPGRVYVSPFPQWDADAMSIEWLVDKVVVPGATGEYFTPRPQDVGKTVTARITFRKEGHTPTPQWTGWARVMPGTLAALRLPQVRGRVEVGRTLRVRPGQWRPSRPHFSYQWLANGRPVRGATRARFTPKQAQVGMRLSVLVEVAAPGYETRQVATKRTKRVRA